MQLKYGDGGERIPNYRKSFVVHKFSVEEKEEKVRKMHGKMATFAAACAVCSRGAMRWPRKRADYPGGCFDLAPDGGDPFISPL